MGKGDKRPSWFKMFIHQKPIVDSVPDAVVGQAIKAAFNYFDSREEPQLDALPMVVFSAIKPYIDESFADYDRDVRNCYRGGRPKKPPVTPGKGGHPSQTQAEAEAEAEAESEARNNAVKPHTRQRFSPPSVDEVRSFCEEQKISVDAMRFVSFYESNGWRVGRNPMKSWQAAVRSWSRKDENQKRSVSSGIPDYGGEENWSL